MVASLLDNYLRAGSIPEMELFLAPAAKNATTPPPTAIAMPNRDADYRWSTCRNIRAKRGKPSAGAAGGEKLLVRLLLGRLSRGSEIVVLGPPLGCESQDH